MFKIMSAITVAGFLTNTIMCMYEAIVGNYGISAGFGLVACFMFFLMVIFSYCGNKK